MGIEIEVVKSEIRDRDYPRKWDTDYHKRYTQPARIYFGFEGENFLDYLYNRRSRPHMEIKKLLPATLANLGVTYKGVRWSQKAGCSCGCSPGFILYNSNIHFKDVILTLKVTNHDNQTEGQPLGVAEGSNVRSS